MGEENKKIMKEEVIAKLKDDGDFDKLRLKIVRKLKDNVLIPIIDQEVNPEPQKDNIEQLSIQDEVTVPEEQTQQLQEQVSLGRSTRERRNAIPDDYVVFLQEHEDDNETMEDDPINFHHAMKSSNSQK
ncbi:uncharacterized protein [Gossypium hirsutum]|uniref:Uncharacterized protein LOC107914943 n=1 Tax=Gossypium hirsutum TaxID=3635 RepID=A0A1U8KAI6_GOSHI|nr:uncharacterized protein LOC107914943 [Gossypium hirsutum]XP_016699499.1 uncharacterized protein LOC107914943 [Gossypium hirsutum]XP_016699500.1 uncharacterized protein LOC107914943 [Gossypium hirsutum]